MACAHAGSARTPATGGPWAETSAMALERSWTTPWQRWPRRPEGLSARRGRTWQPSAEGLVLPGPRRGRPRRRGPRRRRTEGVARGPGPPCPPGLPTRQAGRCGEARRARRHAQAASGRGPRGRPGHRQGPRRRPPAPRAGQAQVRSRAAGQPRSQVSYQARRGLSGGLGVCQRRGLAGRSLPHRVPCAGMSPLRHVVRRVLPERTSGEPVHRYGARLHADGRAGMGVDRQHEVRRDPPRLGRQAGLAGRLRDVHGLRGLQDQTMQAEASLHER